MQQPTAGIYSFQSSFSITNGPQSATIFVSEIQVNWELPLFKLKAH